LEDDYFDELSSPDVIKSGELFAEDYDLDMNDVLSLRPSSDSRLDVFSEMGTKILEDCAIDRLPRSTDSVDTRASEMKRVADATDLHRLERD
jgi:hypothetical protein